MYTYAFNIKDISTESIIGVAFLHFDTNSVASRFFDNEINNEDIIYVLSENGGLLFDSSGLYQSDADFSFLFDVKSGEKINVYGKTYIVNEKENKFAQIKIISLTSVERINNIVGSTVRGFYFVMIVVALSSAILIFFSTKFLTKKIKALSSVMRKVKKGDLSVSINVSSDDEIDNLGKDFNDMVIDLREHIQKVYNLGVQQKNSAV